MSHTCEGGLRWQQLYGGSLREGLAEEAPLLGSPFLLHAAIHEGLKRCRRILLGSLPPSASCQHSPQTWRPWDSQKLFIRQLLLGCPFQHPTQVHEGLANAHHAQENCCIPTLDTLVAES